MPTYHPTRRRSSWLWKSFLTLSVLVLGVGSTIAGLKAAGMVTFPWEKPAAEPSREGMVAVPMSGSAIPAYAKVNRDHLANLQTRQLNVMWLPKESISPDVLLNVSQIIGRVMDHEKPAGYAFTESDFMPKGTRAGLVAGIPPGKRSLTIEATRLDGVFGLRPGDHIDLLATTPIDQGRGPANRKGTTMAQVQAASLQGRATVRPLAQDAVIVSPVTTRTKPVSSSSLMNGAKTTAVPVQEIVLAVTPEEVPLISEALATDVAITCVARSGRPDDPGPATITPGSNPLSTIKVIETMSGNRRDTVVFGGDYSRETISNVADARSTQPPLDPAERSTARD